MVGIVYWRVIPIYGFIFHLRRVKPRVHLLYTKAIAAFPFKCITDEAFSVARVFTTSKGMYIIIENVLYYSLYWPSSIALPRAYHTTIHHTLKICLAAPHIANILSRFPVKPKGCIRFVHYSKYMLNWIDLIREVFPVEEWWEIHVSCTYVCVTCWQCVCERFCGVYGNWEESHRSCSRLRMFRRESGSFVKIEALEQYPNQCGSWIISGVQCVPVNAILCVLPQAGTWAEHIYKPDHIVGTTSLTQLNDGVKCLCVCVCVCVKCVCCRVHFGYICVFRHVILKRKFTHVYWWLPCICYDCTGIYGLYNTSSFEEAIHWARKYACSDGSVDDIFWWYKWQQIKDVEQVWFIVFSTSWTSKEGKYQAWDHPFQIKYLYWS